MVTKEHNSKRFCCFYVSDFHLEMILLPYIKKNIEQSEIIIITEKSLLESIKILLEKTNFSLNEKNKILNLNWNSTKIDGFVAEERKNQTIIINGSIDYIFKINEKLKNKNIKRIDCYNINEKKLNIKQIKENYDEILNTKNCK